MTEQVKRYTADFHNGEVILIDNRNSDFFAIHQRITAVCLDGDVEQVERERAYLLKQNKQLQQRVSKLESDRYIDRIKATGIEEAINGFRRFSLSINDELNCAVFDDYLCDYAQQLLKGWDDDTRHN